MIIDTNLNINKKNGNGDINQELTRNFNISLNQSLLFAEKFPILSQKNRRAMQFSVSQAKYNNVPQNGFNFVEVTFKSKRKKFFKNDQNFSVDLDDYVVVEIENNGIDIGNVTDFGINVSEKIKINCKDGDPCYKVLRLASDDDLDSHFSNIHEEDAVLAKTKELATIMKLDMKVTEAEWQLDKQRLTIFFTAPQRIDFRELVRELARTFRTRIELRQISTREEAKRIGGMGPCGLKLCCSSFSNENCHVTLDHAKTQQLSNNVAKLSGYCGRLKCCLLYEYDTYIDAYKDYPPIQSTVFLPEGRGRIVKIDIFKHKILIQFDQNSGFKTLSSLELDKLNSEGKVKPPERDLSLFANLKKEEIEELKKLTADY